MRRPPGLTLLVSLCALALAPASSAELMLHVKGSKARMQDQTGQRSDGTLAFWNWKQGWRYGTRFDKAFPKNGPVPVISLNTMGRYGGEAITMGASPRARETPIFAPSTGGSKTGVGPCSCGRWRR